MLRRRFQSIALTAGLIASLGALAGPAPVAHAADFSITVPDCSSGGSTDLDALGVAAGDRLLVTITDHSACQYIEVADTLADASTDISLDWNDGSAATFTQSGPSFFYENAGNVSGATELTSFVITLSSVLSAGEIQVYDSNTRATAHTLSYSPAGSGGGGSSPSPGSSGAPGCETDGKPCAVRPWPTATPSSTAITIDWEAPGPLEDGRGGVVSYRVESTPAGGTCTVNQWDLPENEPLPTSCDITGLDPDTDYTFTVYASSHAGEGPGQSTQEAVRLLAAATPAVTVPAITPESPAPTLPATGQQTVLVGAAVLLIALGAFTTLSARRRRDLSQMAQSIRHP